MTNEFSAYCDEHLKWMEIRAFSPRTIDRRGKAIKCFSAWCSDRHIEQPAQVTRQILERYQKHLYHHRKKDGKPLTFGTQVNYLCSIKMFFKWLARDNYIPHNPAADLELPKVGRSLPQETLTREEVETILRQPDIHTVLGLRNRAMLELFYACGPRRAEVANLKIYDVDLNHQTLRIRKGKGGKDRILPMGNRASEWLLRYLEQARPLLVLDPHEDRVFLTKSGKAFSINKMSDHVNEIMVKAEIHKTGSCHLLRHAMATHMLDNGADLRFIQTMLGHADLSTTQIYTQVSIEKLREVHRATHPSAKETPKATQRTEA